MLAVLLAPLAACSEKNKTSFEFEAKSGGSVEQISDRVSDVITEQRLFRLKKQLIGIIPGLTYEKLESLELNQVVYPARREGDRGRVFVYVLIRPETGLDHKRILGEAVEVLEPEINSPAPQVAAPAPGTVRAEVARPVRGAADAGRITLRLPNLDYPRFFSCTLLLGAALIAWLRTRRYAGLVVVFVLGHLWVGSLLPIAWTHLLPARALLDSDGMLFYSIFGGPRSLAGLLGAVACLIWVLQSTAEKRISDENH